jgi:hypothetical protein
VLVALAVVVVLGLLLLTAPRWLVGRRPVGPTTLYFAGLGAGFITIEIGWIKTATRVFGDATVGFSVALLVLLVAAAVGGRISETRNTRLVVTGAIALIAASLGVFVIQRAGGAALAGRPLLARAALLGGMISMGLLMGVPFPAGMRWLTTGPLDRAHGWAANGVCSVVGSVLSAQIALRLGISALFLVGGGAYLVALIAWRAGRGVWR